MRSCRVSSVDVHVKAVSDRALDHRDYGSCAGGENVPPATLRFAPRSTM